MTIALIIVSVLYWASVAADVVSTRSALWRGAGIESNRDFVDDRGQVRYARNAVVSLVTWGCGAAVALALPFPIGAVGLVWIVVRGAFRLADAIHNHRLGRS